MPRTLAAGELWKELALLRLYRIATGTIGDTLTDAAVVGSGAETMVSVVASTNFTAADPAFIIGSGGLERTTIGTPATTMPVSPPPKIAQASGARFVEAVAVNLGKIPQGTINWTSSSALTPVFEEIGRTPVVYIPGTVEFVLNGALFGYNGPNIQFVNGYAEAETGDGAAYATAYQSLVGGIGQATQTEQVLTVSGLRHDAQNIEIDFLNAYIEGAVNSTLGRDAPAQLNFTAKASAIIVRQWT
jgi:hypothetical protein